MNSDTEMELWKKSWTTEPAKALGNTVNLQAETLRQESRLRWKLASDVIAAVMFLAGSLGYASVDRSPEMILWAICIWIGTVAATLFSVSNSRTLWTASAGTVSDYAEIYRLRAKTNLRAANFALRFLAVQVTIAVTWFLIDLVLGRISLGRFTSAMTLIAGLALAYYYWLTWTRKKALTEVERISQIEAEQFPSVV